MSPLRYLSGGGLQERNSDVEFKKFDSIFIGEADGAAARVHGINIYCQSVI